MVILNNVNIKAVKVTIDIFFRSYWNHYWKYWLKDINKFHNLKAFIFCFLFCFFVKNNCNQSNIRSPLVDSSGSAFIGNKANSKNYYYNTFFVLTFEPKNTPSNSLSVPIKLLC